MSTESPTAYPSHSASDMARPDHPGIKSIAVREQEPSIDVCIDVFGGTLALRQKKIYLPQHPKEKKETYNARLNRAVLFNAFKRTVKGMTGMVFRESPEPDDDVPTKLLPLLDNVDLVGSDLPTFLKSHFRSKLKLGHAVILVDWHGPDDAERRIDEQINGARPYWTRVSKDQILRFRTSNRGGRILVTMFAYMEVDTIEDGEFADKEIFRVREYRLTEAGRVAYRSWTADSETATEWDLEQDEPVLLGERMDEIPIVVDYADQTGVLSSDPPLLDLALENLEHWRVRSERMQSLGISGIPVFVTKGVDADDIGTFAVGSAIGLALPEADMGAGFEETSGNALEATRLEVQDIEQRMAALGLSMLVRKNQRPQTAEAERLNRSEQDSELSEMVKSTQNAMGDVMRLTAKWEGEDEGGSITMNTDFDLDPISAETLKEFRELWLERAISWETLVEIIRRGERMPDDFTAEREKERLEEEERTRLGSAITTLASAGGDPDLDEEDDEEEEEEEGAAE